MAKNTPIKRQQITIKHVAEMAGVSQMTVSRVINRRGLVKPATQKKVEKAIKALNYRPNIMARRLAGGSSLFIGLVFDNPSTGYLTNILLGALEACRVSGHHLVLENFGSPDRSHNAKEVAEYLNMAGLDGVIVVPPMSNYRPVIDELHKLDIPCVRIAPENIHTETLRVAIDDVAAADDMTQLIINAGHERIAFIQGPEIQPSSAHRFEGFKKAMKRNGLEVDPNYVDRGLYTYRSGMEAADRLLALNTPPTAIFAGNDDMAAGVIASAGTRGISVPKQLSVAGFDDTELSRVIWPQLTTVNQPIADMSKRAVELLEAYIGGDEERVSEARELLDYAIIKRGSVVPPS